MLLIALGTSNSVLYICMMVMYDNDMYDLFECVWGPGGTGTEHA